MVILIPEREWNCLYCGQKTSPPRKRKGEHVIPEALGGGLYISDHAEVVVCEKCNNGVLSVLDRELCNRSFLSMVASQEIGAEVWQAWDVEHSGGNQLLEARPVWEDGELKDLHCYPQILFNRSGPEMFGDHVELSNFGYENSQKVLYRAAIGAYQRWMANARNGLHFERMESRIVNDSYTYSPRVYTNRSIQEISRRLDRQSFVVRYRTEAEKRFALRRLSQIEACKKPDKWTWKPGSREPAVAILFDMGLVTRALMKIGVNLLATFCTKTPVNHLSFEQTINLIRGISHPSEDAIKLNGFVHAEDWKEFASEGHSFRVVHLRGIWQVYASYFGGKIGTVSSFPGPNCEEWDTLDIKAPLKSKHWEVEYKKGAKSMKFRRVFKDVNLIAPSLKWLRTKSEVIAEKVVQKSQRPQ
jgi:hypothetical protein